MLSDGITELPKCVTTVVIAGMGGKAIVNILKKDLRKLDNVETLVIDAHSCIPFVRDEVSKIGYSISEEKIIKEDGIFYEIIRFTKSDVAFYSDDDIEFGPILRKEKSALFKEKYQSSPRIVAYLQLPEAFRSLSRPSSAPDAKAFPLCSSSLNLLVLKNYAHNYKFRQYHVRILR